MIFTNTKKKYFQEKLKGVEKMKWDYEFKMFKTKELREEVRKEYDRMRDMADAFKQQVENKDNKPETIKIFEEKLEATNKQVAELAEQLAEMDHDIEGTDKTKRPSLQAQIDGLAELRKMLSDYIIKKI